MSKRFKSQASSSRAASTTFGNSAFGGFTSASSQQQNAASSLSYISEPPDLSQISDPQVVVAFKNLLKKDSTTKSKALEDLQTLLNSGHSEARALEDGLLEAWTNLYPRTSIDSSRKVRQLAHSLQGYLVLRTGKRIARHLPRVVGSWLAGQYDNDKQVQRAAQESIATAFATEEKRIGIWKVYQSAILDFVVDALLQQTPQTLSDERTVRPDEADAKYARVVGTGILVFSNLLAVVGAANLPRDAVESLTKSRSLWKFGHHDDPFARRSLYELLSNLLSADESYLDWKLISGSILSKALSISQRGSASEFSNVLLSLTKKHPQLWTTDYSGKTAASARLLQYMKKGSQGAFPAYWSNLCLLLKALPEDILNGGDDGPTEFANSLITAFHEGIRNREEPRANLGYAWSAYTSTVAWLSTLLPSKDDGLQLLRGHVAPVLMQYVLDDPEQSQWAINDPLAGKICVDCILNIARSRHSDMIPTLWTDLTDALVRGLKVSSPEKSQGYRESQNAVCAQASRFFDLESEVLNNSTTPLEVLLLTFTEATTRLLLASIDVLRSRNGKPYGAAAMIAEAVTKVPQILEVMDFLDDFLVRDIPELVLSPSADHLVSVLFQCRDRPGFQDGLKKVLDKLSETGEETQSILGVSKLFSSVKVEDMKAHAKIQSLAFSRLHRGLEGDRDAWADVIVLLRNPASRRTAAPRIISSITDALSANDGKELDALDGLNRIVTESKEPIRAFSTGPDGSKLIARLLYLAESPVDEIAALADSVQAIIRDLMNADGSTDSAIEIIDQSFQSVRPTSLSVDSLVNLAEEVLLKTPPETRPQVFTRLLPSNDHWNHSLQAFMRIPPKLSSSLISPLGGTVYLVNRSAPEAGVDAEPRDSNNYTLAHRLALYVTRLLSQHSFTEIGKISHPRLFHNLPLVIQLIDDDLNQRDTTGILILDSSEVRDECAELVSCARRHINEWIHSAANPLAVRDSATVVPFWEHRMSELRTDAPKVYRIAEAFVKVVSEREAMGLFSTAEPSLMIAEQMPAATAPLVLPACLAAYKQTLIQSPSSTKLCNRLISDLTDLGNLPDYEGLRKMISFNILTQGENSVARRAATQRLVFLVKHLVQCLQSNEMSVGLTSETLKTLTTVFPPIKEIYGSHWSDVLDIIKGIWESGEPTDEYLPVLHSSLRLFSCLRSLCTTAESNDDLEEAWNAAQKTHPAALVDLLTKFDQSSTQDLPWNITADLLARELSALNVKHVEDVCHIFAALSINSRGIQRAAYHVLNRVIPRLQEAVSFDVALSDAPVNLPDELMSLLLDPPTAASIRQQPAQDTLWLDVRSYLLSWKAVFDHFIHSSLPVRERYSANIKEHDCFPPLLEFMFDFLQDQRDRLIDASKFAIREFEPDQSESAEKEIQWLLVHLYFLCLRYLPNLTKAWWMDSKKRIKGPIELWTQKYISPLVIQDSLNDVSQWFSSQDWANEEQPLEIKVSQRAAEIVASIEIDDESPPTSIAISLPPTYPLQQAIVTGRYRVAVDEKKWKNWMLTIQGVIMFSNGNLIDGVRAFRRNVQGALKGHNECIICQSVISSDMQTPNKRCATCKQTFHSQCLFQWFRTSNSSGCPLCRNNFLYG